jgi:hypothetical protein
MAAMRFSNTITIQRPTSEVKPTWPNSRTCDETGLAITVCHLPPGTSKWNRIEHRLCSAISMNWRGHRLESHQVTVELIGVITTQAGLRVRAELDRGRLKGAQTRT